MDEQKNVFDELKEAVEGNIKHWWVYLILGILSIGIGIWMAVTPFQSYIAFSIVFAVSFLFSGISSLFMTISNRQSIPGWGWHLASAIIMLIFGIMLIATPGMTELTFVYYVAFGIMFGGFNTIAFSFTLKRSGDSGWGFNLALGILVILFAILLMTHPLFTALTIGLWGGIAFISLGISFCVLAWRLSKVNKMMK